MNCFSCGRAAQLWLNDNHDLTVGSKWWMNDEARVLEMYKSSCYFDYSYMLYVYMFIWHEANFCPDDNITAVHLMRKLLLNADGFKKWQTNHRRWLSAEWCYTHSDCLPCSSWWFRQLLFCAFTNLLRFISTPCALWPQTAARQDVTNKPESLQQSRDTVWDMMGPWCPCLLQQFPACLRPTYSFHHHPSSPCSCSGCSTAVRLGQGACSCKFPIKQFQDRINGWSQTAQKQEHSN